MNDKLHTLWPTPILVKTFPEHQSVNAELVKLFYQHRELHGGAARNVYSSQDDLLQRYDHPALKSLFGFISNSVFEIADAMNKPIWQQTAASKLQMHIVGAWFQIQNQYGFHDIHNHGNCSWSGVYYVQIDDTAQREQHSVLGQRNGITRFYSHQLNLLGGAHIDMGNAYLQQSTFDMTPKEGGLIVFPSWLNHKAMPYDGEKDRIIISFNAQVHGENKNLDYDFV
jgi:uncharacterized protein (TIGR02466 family)